MARGETRTLTLWRDTAVLPSYQRLRESTEADVVVIGAGIAGLTTAYLLAREGRRVLVLDDGEVAGGETGNTTAHLASAFDDRFTEVERMFGEEASRIVAASHSAAIRMIEEIASLERIDCDFTWLDGYLFPGPDGIEPILEEERAARAAGLDVALTHSPPYDPFRVGVALRFTRQARIHPLRFVGGVARAIEAKNGRICTGTKVCGVHGGPTVRVQTSSGLTVAAKA